MVTSEFFRFYNYFAIKNKEKLQVYQIFSADDGFKSVINFVVFKNK